jgi:hypothetical protein
MPRLIQIQRKPPELSPAAAERLRHYASARARSAAAERCEFCGADIDASHGHLVDLPRRALLCVCRPCYLLFTHDGAGGARFRAVPERYRLVPELAGDAGLWEALQLPIGLAFFFTNGSTRRTTAFYPSPAGATESELPLDAWENTVRIAPALGGMLPDVEALLVRRSERSADALIVPIDACYELVGRIRRSWRGLQGGDEAHREIDDFFSQARLRASAAPASPADAVSTGR